MHEKRITKGKIQVTKIENLQENLMRLDEMAALYKQYTGLPVNIWLDDMGISRNVKHNTPRIKFQNDSGNNLNRNLVPISIDSNPKILVDIDVPAKIESAVKWFIQHNRDLLEQHFNQEITTKDFDQKMRIAGFYSFFNTIEIPPNNLIQLFDEDDLRTEFARISRGHERIKKDLLVEFLVVFFNNKKDCILAIDDYDQKVF